MKRGSLCLFFICLFSSLTGCSETDVTVLGAVSGMETGGDMDLSMDADSMEGDTGLFVNEDCIRQCVDAAYRDDELQDGIGYCFLLTGDDLYYWNGISAGAICGNIHIYREEGETREVEEIAALRDKILLFYTADEERNLYYLYLKDAEEGNSLFLHKDGPDGGMIYDIPVSSEAESQMLENFYRKGYFWQGTISSDGKLILGSITGDFWLFDEKGEFFCSGRDSWIRPDGTGWSNKGILNAGAGGIFTYETTGSQLLLSEISMENGTTGSMRKVTIDTASSLSVFSGYNRGILISDGNGLWEYDPAAKELNRLFGWNDPGVRMGDCRIWMIGSLEDGRLYVMDDQCEKVYLKPGL